MAQVVADGRLSQGLYDIGARRPVLPPRPALWRSQDLLRWGVTVGLGGIVVAVAWYLCAGDVSFSRQIGPTDAAVAGLLVAGVGNVGWLLRGRRLVGERRRALLPDAAPRAAEHAVVRRIDEGHGGDVGALCVAGDELERFHRPDCPLAVGRDEWRTMTRTEHGAAGRRPCGVCRP
jgi:hypothetical protein